MRQITLIIALTTLTACADVGLTNASETPGDSLDTGSFGIPEADADDDGELLQADLMSLDGTVQIVDGELDIAASELDLTLFDGSQILCTGAITLSTASSAPPADTTVEASSFWTVEADASDLDTSLCPLPDPFVFGLGAVPYDASLTPAAETSGFQDSFTTAYGAVIELEAGGPAYLFGVMGTDAQFDGDAATDPAAPLQDGSYTLRTLYLLPLPAER